MYNTGWGKSIHTPGYKQHVYNHHIDGTTCLQIKVKYSLEVVHATKCHPKWEGGVGGGGRFQIPLIIVYYDDHND